MANVTWEMSSDRRGDNQYLVKVDGAKVGAIFLLHEGEETFWTAWLLKDHQMVVKKKSWLETLTEFKRTLKVDENIE